jgi:transposase-like protein
MLRFSKMCDILQKNNELLKEIKEGTKMASYVITCPYCKSRKNASQNSSYKCQSCGATIFIGNDGKIKNSKSGRK